MSVLLLPSAGWGVGTDSCRTKIKRSFVPTGFNWQGEGQVLRATRCTCRRVQPEGPPELTTRAGASSSPRLFRAGKEGKERRGTPLEVWHPLPASLKPAEQARVLRFNSRAGASPRRGEGHENQPSSELSSVDPGVFKPWHGSIPGRQSSSYHAVTHGYVQCAAAGSQFVL